MEKQKIKIDCNLLNGSIEIVLLNRLYKENLIDEKIYRQAKESIVREYKLEGYYRFKIDMSQQH